MVALSGRYSNPLGDRVPGSSPDEGRADDDPPPPRSRTRHRHWRLSEQQVDDLVAGYLNGRTVAELVTEFGVHRATVSALLHKRGVETRVLPRRMTDDDVRLAADLYRSGESLAMLGRRFGVCDSTVLREFRKAGVPTRPRQGR